MSLGEEFLSELGLLGKRYSYFSFREHQELKRVESIDALRHLLREWGFDNTANEGDVAHVARNLAETLDANDSSIQLLWRLITPYLFAVYTTFVASIVYRLLIGGHIFFLWPRFNLLALVVVLFLLPFFAPLAFLFTFIAWTQGFVTTPEFVSGIAVFAIAWYVAIVRWWRARSPLRNPANKSLNVSARRSLV